MKLPGWAWLAVLAGAWWTVRRLGGPGEGGFFQSVAEAQGAAMRAARGEKP
jgi:hypothetical protein